MLSPLIRRARKDRNTKGNIKNDARSKERGVTIALVALSMVGIIAMAALSIDVGSLYQAKAEAQRAADAGALAAARVISVSGVTGDPNNTSGSWQPVCGTSGTATLAAIAIAQAQWNFVGGVAANKVTVNYGPGSASNDCSTLVVGTSFSVNPTVTVYVQNTSVPTFFAHVFGLFNSNWNKTSVSATATAEVFNPSNSGAYASGGEMVPVQPRCVKPWIVPNFDPWHPSSACTGGTCSPIVSTVAGAEGSILNGGVSLNGGGGGVIGETFNLVADCSASGGYCNAGAPYNPQPSANVTGTATPNLQYLPGLVTAPASAAPSCSTANLYQEAVGGCDQNTVYQCGVQSAGAPTPNQIDLTENPSGPAGDSATAAQCLIQYGHPAATGQDILVDSSFPFQVQAGSSNPLNVSGSNISSSDSIVSLPIYDSATPLAAGTQPPVTIVGFLQVFINQVNADGSISVTVLNVAGCGNQVPAGTTVLNGTSPVPVRLITPP